MTLAKQQHAITKYLARYAENVCCYAKAIAECLHHSDSTKSFSHCVVIPCFNETPDFAFRLMSSTLWHQNMLAIVVVNQSLDTAATSTNLVLWESFCRDARAAKLSDDCVFLQGDNSAFLVLDRFNAGKGISPKYGVGLARKFGCDLAVSLTQSGILQSEWMHSTDADALLPENYFDLPDTHCSALVFRHQHIQGNADDRVFQATQTYEKAIDYYTAGLTWAGSPYAFPTIGSCMAVKVTAYCQARGFPKKAAGEDFYLLNKLAKLEGVFWCTDIIVELEARQSDRNPFGTGPAVEAILANDWTMDTYPYYAPAVFDALKTLLSAMARHLAQVNSQPDTYLEKVDLFTGEVAEVTDAQTHNIQQALQALNIQDFYQHIHSQRLTGHKAVQAWHSWFDAFRTLKFIRTLQTHCYPPQALRSSLDQIS